VIDSSDTSRLQTSRSELLTMLSEEELAGVPLLVFCNKQDIEGALKPEEISEQLGLAGGEKGRDWSVRGSCATEGEGIEEGLDWCVTNEMRAFSITNTCLTGSSMRYRRSKNTSSDHLVAFVIYLPWRTDIVIHIFLYVVLSVCEVGLPLSPLGFYNGLAGRTLD